MKTRDTNIHTVVTLSDEERSMLFEHFSTGALVRLTGDFLIAGITHDSTEVSFSKDDHSPLISSGPTTLKLVGGQNVTISESSEVKK